MVHPNGGFHQRISESMIMIDNANIYMIISWQGIIYLDNMHATFIYHYHTLTVSLMFKMAMSNFTINMQQPVFQGPSNKKIQTHIASKEAHNHDIVLRESWVGIKLVCCALKICVVDGVFLCGNAFLCGFPLTNTSACGGYLRSSHSHLAKREFPREQCCGGLGRPLSVPFSYSWRISVEPWQVMVVPEA